MRVIYSDKGNEKDSFSFIEKLFVFLLTCLSISYVVKYYASSSGYAVFIYAVSILFILLGLFYNGRFFHAENSYEAYLLLVYIICVFSSLIHISSGNVYGGKVECFLIYSGILTAFLYKKIDLKVFERLFVITGIIAIILFLFVLSRTSINIVSAIGRGYQWTEIFYYCNTFCLAPAFLIYALLKNKHILLSVIVVLADIIINLIVVKRIILIETLSLVIVIVLMALLKKEGRSKYLKLLFAVLILVFGLLLYFGDSLFALYDSVFNRTMAVANSDNMSEFDRFLESINYFQNTSFFDILIGRGFSGSHTGLGINASALHVGWMNFVLKGGIFLFLLAVIPYFKCFRLLSHFKKCSLKKQFSISFLLYMLPMLFLTNMHAFEPTLFLFFYCCIEIMNRKGTFSINENVRG